MKKVSLLAIMAFAMINWLFSQQNNYSNLVGPYLGQTPPGLTPELFASDLVSVAQGVHGNIVFTSDFTEAAWHPNYKVNGKSIIYIMKFRNGKWEKPEELLPKGATNCSEPFYSYDGKRLYFLSGNESTSGNAENEKIYFVERNGDWWTEPKLLSPTLPVFHWQFSLDKNNNLYFGGKSDDKKSEIFFSKYSNGTYLTPVRISEAINSSASEFSPFIAPDNSYLVFTRMIEKEKAPPQMNLFVSFKDKNGDWTKAQNLTNKIGLPVQSPFVMMNAARITPDGKFLFFCYFNGKGHMVYWVSTKVIEELRPKDK